MLRALYTSASGMQGQQMNLDVIANNLANVNTTGFKKSKIEFQDMLYQTSRAAGAAGTGPPSSLSRYLRMNGMCTCVQKCAQSIARTSVGTLVARAFSKTFTA